MSPPLVLPLQDCHDPSLVGGKALGLAQLMAGGFPVPTGVCITTAAYHAALGAAGFSPLDRWQQALEHTGDVRRAWLADCRSMVRGLEVTALVDACLTAMRNVSGTEGRRWAVRSSSTNEDAAGMGFAGQYRTELGVATQTMSQAITAVWASIWEEHVLDYAAKAGTSQAPPAMAVVCQPMLAAQRAGVAYSIHPVTGRDNHITINAVRGLGAALVDGSVSPDQYVVETGADGEPIRVRRRCLGHQSDRLVLTAEGVRTEPVPGHERDRDSLADPELFELARVVKRIERAGHGPVDVEWAIEAGRLWVLQARPITAVRPSSELTDDECEWSRTNFKETMPELPSPLGISFLERFMAAYIVAHYRRLGCRIPPGLSSVRTLFGRPYINLTLFHSLVGQLRGDPSMNVEQMGGEPLRSVPAVRPLGVRAMVRALWLVWREMRRVVRESPRNFAQMKQMAATYSRDRLASYPLAELGAELDGIGRWLDEHEVTFGIAAGVGQCLQTFSLLLPRWLGDDWRSLLNAALQGQGTVISAQQIIRLAELAELARHDDRVLRALEQGASDYRACRSLVQGTPFLSAFDRYVDDYGHRGLGESDVMSPRFGEQPEVVLGVIRTQLRGPASTPADIVERQRVRRERALAEIRARWLRVACGPLACLPVVVSAALPVLFAARGQSPPSDVVCHCRSQCVASDRGAIGGAGALGRTGRHVLPDPSGACRSPAGSVARLDRPHRAATGGPGALGVHAGSGYDPGLGRGGAGGARCGCSRRRWPTTWPADQHGHGHGTCDTHSISRRLESGAPRRHHRGAGHRSRHGSVVRDCSRVDRRDGWDPLPRGDYRAGIRPSGPSQCPPGYASITRWGPNPT